MKFLERVIGTGLGLGILAFTGWQLLLVALPGLVLGGLTGTLATVYFVRKGLVLGAAKGWPWLPLAMLPGCLGAGFLAFLLWLAGISLVSALQAPAPEPGFVEPEVPSRPWPRLLRDTLLLLVLSACLALGLNVFLIYKA